MDAHFATRARTRSRRARTGAVLALSALAGTATAATATPAAAAAPAAAPAASRHVVLVVAPDGSDRASGSAAHPLRTVAAAVRRLPRAGGTVELEQGVYHQRITIAHRQGIEIRPRGRAHVVLSGAGLVVPRGTSAMVDIADSSRITIRGLSVTGYRTAQLEHTPIGVYVHGHDDAVRIVGNHVHDLGNDNGTLGSFDLNAHGIAAYGDDPHRAATGLVIEGNTVDHLRLGASESVVVNGNVDGWRISRNHVFANDNIGIDAIGFEPTLTGRYRYTTANRARNGVVDANVVQRIRSRGNPSYWEGDGWCNCADGIYVDGGTHIAITGNRVEGDDIGIEVAAENARGEADHVLVAGNTVTGSLFTGITTGGYCNGARACGGVRTGTSHDNVFTGNRLRGNNQLDDGSPELLVQYFAYRDTFSHNTITATNRAHAVYGTVPGRGAAGVPGEPANTSDHNTFAATGTGPAGLQLGWAGTTYRSPAAYRAATGQDRHSTFR